MNVVKRQNIKELKKGVLAKNQILKNDSFKALLVLARENPQTLYADWDFFAGLIAPDRGADTKYIGLYIIAHLTGVDVEGKFERLFDDFYALLDDDSIIPASHAALMSGTIVNNLPQLEPQVTGRLLTVDSTHHTPARKALIKSYVIAAFDTYFDNVHDIEDKKRILSFVRAQQTCLSPKTRKYARDFLKKRGAWADTNTKA
jgi:hypothetical protein